MREKNINKPTPFTGDRKKIKTFIQECKMYLRINWYIYEDNEDKIAFVLSFMNEKEALRWKQTFLRFIMEINEEISKPKKNSPLQEKNINKPTPFTGNRKKIEMFIQECKMYLWITDTFTKTTKIR